MKILIMHNDYGRFSGEEAVVNQMEKMFTAGGHQVNFYRPSTAAYQAGFGNKLQMLVAGIYSLQGVRGIKRVLRTERPDIINIHNLYPFISPAALFACKEAGIPVVMSVHNYRLICPTGLFLRDGRPCEYCLERGNEWGCVRFNCEKNIFRSVGYALRGAVARQMGAYRKNVDRFVCLTAFQRTKLIEAGFMAEKITVIPNSVALPPAAAGAVGGYIAYVGRLSEEKGWDLLAAVARRNPGLSVEVAGAVRDMEEDGGSEPLPGNIRFRGFLDAAGLSEFYRGARFLVIPSRCYEGFPVVALEAMSLGKPVVVPDHGGFTEIVGRGREAPGCLFRPNDVADLETVILDLWADEERVRVMGRRAAEKVRERYSAEMVSRRWDALLQEMSI